MSKKTQILFYALLDFLNIKEGNVLEEGFGISTTTKDVCGAPFIKELNIALRYIDEEELKAYRDEQ